MNTTIANISICSITSCNHSNIPHNTTIIQSLLLFAWRVQVRMVGAMPCKHRYLLIITVCLTSSPSCKHRYSLLLFVWQVHHHYKHRYSLAWRVQVRMVVSPSCKHCITIINHANIGNHHYCLPGELSTSCTLRYSFLLFAWRVQVRMVGAMPCKHR